jgi:hypothetical protein
MRKKWHFRRYYCNNTIEDEGTFWSDKPEGANYDDPDGQYPEEYVIRNFNCGPSGRGSGPYSD